jgi:hypothetical protein
MKLTVFCCRCGKQCEWEIHWPTREEIRQSKCRDIQEYINRAKKGFACDECC